MHLTSRTLTLLTLTAGAMLLPACTGTQSTHDSQAQAAADKPCPLRARLDEHGSLTKDQLVPLLHSPEGRETIARFADEYDTVFYDGHNRYAQIVRTQSSTEIPVLTFYFAWQHPDYTYPRTIMFTENAVEDHFDIDFQPDSIRVTVNANEPQPHQYTLNWDPDEMAPWGYIMTSSDRIILND